VSEQSQDERPFNRGAVINIACDVFKDKAVYMITHDVDLYPNKQTIEKYYTKKMEVNHIFGLYTSECNTLGGIIKMKLETFQTINGFPNDFWGWGVEDKALQNRAETYNVNIQKLITDRDPKRTDYFSILDDINDKIVSSDFSSRTSFEYGIFKTLPYAVKIDKCLSSGLNTLNYKILEQKNVNTRVTHIISQIE